jgi:hypothetical protein
VLIELTFFFYQILSTANFILVILKTCFFSIRFTNSEDNFYTQTCIQMCLNRLIEPWKRSLFEKLTGYQLGKNFPTVYGIDGLLLYSRQPIICLYLHPDESNPSPNIRLFKPSLIVSSHLLLGLKTVAFLQVF